MKWRKQIIRLQKKHENEITSMKMKQEKGKKGVGKYKANFFLNNSTPW